jgi:hypothetical protein
VYKEISFFGGTKELELFYRSANKPWKKRKVADLAFYIFRASKLLRE